MSLLFNDKRILRKTKNAFLLLKVPKLDVIGVFENWEVVWHWRRSWWFWRFVHTVTCLSVLQSENLSVKLLIASISCAQTQLCLMVTIRYYLRHLIQAMSSLVAVHESEECSYLDKSNVTRTNCQVTRVIKRRTLTKTRMVFLQQH